MPLRRQTTDFLSSTRQPRTPSLIHLRWHRLAPVAVGLAVGAVSTLAFEIPDTTPAVTSIPTTCPDTVVDQPWYDPHPPCWITNTCPRE
jgi:hypothetical protein